MSELVLAASDEKFKLAQRHFRSRNFDDAIGEISKAIFLTDQVAEYFTFRGQCYIELGDYKSAIASFHRSYKLVQNPDIGKQLSKMLVAEGVSRLEDGELALAVHCFNEALLSKSDDTFALVQKAFALIGMQQYPAALEELQKFCTITPSNVQVLIVMARLHKHAKNSTAAAERVQEALRIAPNDDDVCRLYSEVKGGASEMYSDASNLIIDGKLDKAISTLNQAIDLDPTDVRYLIRRGVVYRMLGQHEKAINDLNEALRISKNTNRDALRQLTIAYNELAVELHSHSNHSRAIAYFGLAIANEPGIAMLYMNRGDVYRDIGQPDKAMSDYVAAYERDKNNTEVCRRLALMYDARGLAYMDEKQWKRAQVSFAEAMKCVPNVPHLILHHGLACLQLGDVEQAHDDFSEVVRLDPSNEVAWARLQLFQRHPSPQQVQKRHEKQMHDAEQKQQQRQRQILKQISVFKGESDLVSAKPENGSNDLMEERPELVTPRNIADIACMEQVLPSKVVRELISKRRSIHQPLAELRHKKLEFGEKKRRPWKPLVTH